MFYNSIRLGMWEIVHRCLPSGRQSLALRIDVHGIYCLEYEHLVSNFDEMCVLVGLDWICVYCNGSGSP